MLVIYELMQIAQEREEAGEAPQAPLTAVVSHDEKPDIWAIGGVAPTLRPGPAGTPPRGATTSTSGSGRSL